MGAILGMGLPQALVHTVHSTSAFGTCACGKPIPKIAPMAKLDTYIINISTWRKGGPLSIIPGFFLHSSLEPSYGYLRFEGNGKIPLGR